MLTLQALKKKIGLRAKASKAPSLAAKIAAHKTELAAQPEYHENPLLKLLKSTKKEKQQSKTKAFNEKLLQKVTFNLSGNVSKSARRRRARKEKEQLKPKMDDLLTSLPQETVNIVSSTNISNGKFVKDKEKANDHKPKASKQKGHQKLMQTEKTRFSQVLNNQEFKKSPFAALRQAIGNNLGSS